MKKTLMILVLMLFSIWTVSADLSEWLFCLIKKDEVTISLRQTAWYYKCKDTIVSLEHLMVDTAKDLMKIQTYIYRGNDLDFWKSIRTQKQDLIKKLQASKATILTNIDTFQSNLLQKSIQYFIIKITPYELGLQKSLVKIQALTLSGYSTPSLDAYASLLKQQVVVIDSFGKITTTQELTDLLAQYVYLKKEIEWKYE